MHHLQLGGTSFKVPDESTRYTKVWISDNARSFEMANSTDRHKELLDMIRPLSEGIWQLVKSPPTWPK